MTETLDVAILGAGFAGIGMAIHLEQQGGYRYALFEKASRLGGTWRDNTYPGAACDVPSLLYSYSFEPRSTWSRLFAPQPEILDYMEHCARKYHVLPHIRFDTEITRAAFENELWHITTARGETIQARFLVMGCGQLNRPCFPNIPGRETFNGTAFHSARWNPNPPLEGKRVAVIGNGASAVQFIPEIAPRAQSLQIFQRTPNYILPKPDQLIEPEMQARLERFPAYERALRYLVYVLMEARWPAFRHAGLVRRWMKRTCLEHLHFQIADPDLRDALTPNYPIGCKRVLLTNDYYPTLLRRNVELISSPITAIEPKGLRTEDDTLHPVDTLIYATGFETTQFLAPMTVVGRSGTPLHEAWAQGAEAYMGVAVHDFPNLFILYGPNTNLGHNSIIFMIECEIHYILQCLRALKRRGATTLEPTAQAMKRYNARLQHDLSNTVWAAECGSWYKQEDGKITNNWSSSTLSFWARTRRPRLRDFDFR